MLGGIFDKNDIKSKLQTFDRKILENNFWKDKLFAQKIFRRRVLPTLRRSYETVRMSFRVSLGANNIRIIQFEAWECLLFWSLYVWEKSSAWKKK